MLCTLVPNGILFSGSAFPVFIEILKSEQTVSPTTKFSGWRIYLFSPSEYVNREILQLRFGSYSMLETLADIFNLSLLKSIRRYKRLCPPPLCLLVINFDSCYPKNTVHEIIISYSIRNTT